MARVFNVFRLRRLHEFTSQLRLQVLGETERVSVETQPRRG
jgi:hypothetical protein